MEKPSLEEVRAHFKNATKVRDVVTGNVEMFDKYLQDFIYEDLAKDRYFCRWRKPFNVIGFIELWDSEHGYAEILEYEKESSVDRTFEEVVMSNKDEVIGNVPPSRRVNLKDPAFKSHRFDQTIESTLDHLKELLTVKGKEYRRNGNVFHNFDEGAKITGKLREEVLHGFRLKHEISVNDMRNDLAKDGKLPTKEKVEEKYNDILVYYLIEKASMLDRIDNQKEG